MKMFSVFDRQAMAFLPPFHARAHGQAVRMFMDAVNTKDHDFNKHPEDYELHYVGHFDDQNGVYLSEGFAPKRLLTALDVINKIEVAS